MQRSLEPPAGKDLVARLRSGDRSAAEQLVDLYYQRIYLYMRQLGHNRQTSEDLTQETFMRAWYHIDQLRDNGALAGWLFRIAHNTSYQYRRWIGRRQAQAEPLGLAAQAHGGQAEDDRVAHMELLERLQAAVSRLPWKTRQTVVLHYLQGMPISMAAEVMGVAEGTFKSRLNRALRQLRRIMGE
ncbi:MAG: RNA polymerase sigma factor [Sedimentisphaerales bacterium]|nr:RNA polymerase sigma factor [Sedimentisphaerales bacterium]